MSNREEKLANFILTPSLGRDVRTEKKRLIGSSKSGAVMLRVLGCFLSRGCYAQLSANILPALDIIDHLISLEEQK